MKTAPDTNTHDGFTLLELLLVVAILSSLALAATTFVDNTDNQQRFETTRDRMALLRKAMLGDATLSLNGQPVIGGFVADMGRLPLHIHELLERQFCVNSQYATEAACSAAGETWIDNPVWALGRCSNPAHGNETDCLSNGGNWTANAGNIGSGWRGPYLSILQPANTADAFTDGWGRVAVNLTDQNYGWVLTPAGGNLTIESYGLDQSDGPNNNCGNGYSSDCSFTLTADDYQADISDGISANVLMAHGGACAGAVGTGEISCASNGGTWTFNARDLCMKVFYRKGDGSIETAVSAKKTLTEDGTYQVVGFDSFKAGSTPVNRIPAGQNAIGIYSHDGTDCTGTRYPASKNDIRMVFLARSSTPVVNW